jgi:hypothetical protein
MNQNEKPSSPFVLSICYFIPRCPSSGGLRDMIFPKTEDVRILFSPARYNTPELDGLVIR